MIEWFQRIEEGQPQFRVELYAIRVEGAVFVSEEERQDVECRVPQIQDSEIETKTDRSAELGVEAC